MFISHDLGVVRYFCDRVLVMYLGNTVEEGKVEDLYNAPLHPYTQALLSAIPRPSIEKKRNRIRLQGDLPNPADPPSGCPFHTRCPIARTQCMEEKPQWREYGEEHYAACHFAGESIFKEAK